MHRACYAFAFPGALLLTALLSAAGAVAREKEPVQPSPAAKAMAERQGFAVEPGQGGWLHDPYRWPTGPMFVTADSGLGAYLLCLRRLLFHRAGNLDERSHPLLESWAEALAKGEPGADRDRGVLFLSLLRGLHGVPPNADPEVLDGALERLRAGDPSAPVVGLDTPLDRRPVASEPLSDSLRAALLDVLTEIPGKPESAPPLFSSEAWQRLELQTVLGAQVLWRRAVGVATSASKVFGASDHPGFVHPDPAFWRALAALAKETAAGAVRDGVHASVPTTPEILELERIARKRFDEETPFTELEKDLLRRCGISGGWDYLVLSWAEEAYRNRSSTEARARWREDAEKQLFSEEYGLPALRARRDQLGLPPCVRRLERLAASCRTLAAYAEQQLGGNTPEDAARVLLTYGGVLEDIDGAFEENPVRTAARALMDLDRDLFHGIATMDRLWVLYPWKNGPILCRGAVFSYRELVSSQFVHEADWRRRIASDEPPPRPAWAEAFLALP